MRHWREIINTAKDRRQKFIFIIQISQFLFAQFLELLRIEISLLIHIVSRHLRPCQSSAVL